MSASDALPESGAGSASGPALGTVPGSTPVAFDPVAAFDPDKLRRYVFAPVEQTLTPRDTMLYALGIGFGDDPLDAAQLRYVYEQDLQAAPTMAITLCYPNTLAQFAREIGIRGEKVLHVSQGFSLPAPLPVQGRFVGRSEVTGVYDKGADKGVLWTYRNRVVDAQTGALVCELNAASMALGYGGYGGPRGEAPARVLHPGRPPDHVRDIATLPQAALLYRLSGDYNPVHAVPALARSAGFDRPILHGRCTFGVAGRALLACCCENDASRLKAMSARFSAPVFPGETIRTEIWQDGQQIAFRASVPARGVRVLDQGTATLR